jgi:hypothetical protein
VLTAESLPALPLGVHEALDRARGKAIWIVDVQANLMTTGGGESMGGKTYQESWQTVSRLAREAASELETATR